MAKPKSERNMSALDYLYKKLYWLEGWTRSQARRIINAQNSNSKL